MLAQMPVTPTHWKPDTPLLASLERSEAITPPRLRNVLRRFFLLAADMIQADHPVLADKLRRASITTTSIYLHDDEVQRSQPAILSTPRCLRCSRHTGLTASTGLGTIYLTCCGGCCRFIQRSISLLNQPFRSRCGGFFTNPGQPSMRGN